MDDSKKSPPTPTPKPPSRRVRLFKTLLKTFGPDQPQTEKESKEETEDLTVLFESEGQIKAATLEKLVERITHETFTSDPTILLDLLVTHKNFTTSEKLLAALIDRFKEQVLQNTVDAFNGKGRTMAATSSGGSLNRSGTVSSPGAKLTRVAAASTLASPSGSRGSHSGTVSSGSGKATSPRLTRIFSAMTISLDSPDKNNKDTIKDNKDNKDKDKETKDNKDQENKDNKEKENKEADNTNDNSNEKAVANDNTTEKATVEKPTSFDGDGEDEEEGVEPQIMPSLVHYKIYNVLRTWVDRQWYDFEPDADSPADKNTMLSTLTVFVQQTMPAAGMPELSQQLFHLISAKKYGAADTSIAITRAPPPKPLLPLPSAELELSEGATSSPFWLYQPKEIARQLTIMEHAVFSKIQTHEFLFQAWNKKSEAHKAPYISSAIRQFNKISTWATSEILRAEGLNLRVEAILRFIDIAMNCYAMNNFNTMMALLAAFLSSPIHRLKKTFEALPARDQANLEWLSKLMSFSKNYAMYRDLLKKVEPPCIPYLGIYLTDLTFADEGNSATTGGLINFSKYRKMGGLIRQVMHLKSGTYSLTTVDELQKYIRKYEAMSEEQAYSISLQIEPRAKDCRPEEEEEGTIQVEGQPKFSGDIEIISKEAWANNPSASVRAGESNSRFVLNMAVDPVPLMIVLPGSTGPLLVRVPPTCTGQLAMKRFAEFFNEISEAHTLVVMPNRATPSGYLIEDSALLKNYAASLDVSPPDYVLGVYIDPQPIRVVYYGSSVSEPIVMLLDYGTPLSSIVSTFQAVFKISEDFTFFRYSFETQQIQWISMNRSLSEMQFSLKDHVLFLYSIPLLFTRKPLSECIKSGFLMKRSRKANTILKMTPIKRRWFVLIDRFLLYYKSKNDARPVSVVSLDHHVPRMGHRKGGLCLFIERTCEAFPRPSSQAIYYLLTSEDELELRSWFRTMRKNCGLMGDEPIFGVDMEEVASRPSSKNRIPLIISKTISFLYNSALTLDGVFKQPGSTTIVEQLKKQFDMGLNVEFSHSTDPFAVASLLVLYLEELPGPLATYDLYTQFIACGATLAPTNELSASKLRSLISMLPLSNICVLNYLLAFLSQFASENPLGKQGVIEIFTRLVLRPNPDFTGDPGTETAENVFEKLLSLHDLVFHGLIETLAKQQTVTLTPKVSEIEDVLANELAPLVQGLISERKLVFSTVSINDMKFNAARYQKFSPQSSPGDAPLSPFACTDSDSSSPGSLSSSNSFDNLPLLQRAPSQSAVDYHHFDSHALHRSVSQPVLSALIQGLPGQRSSMHPAQHSPPFFAQPSPPSSQTTRSRELQRAYEMQEGIMPAQPQASPQKKPAQQSTPETQVQAHTPPQQEAQKQQTPPQGAEASPPSTTAQGAQVTSPQPKQPGTVFGTHRLRPQYSASAPLPQPSLQNAAPARAHNNTSPAAVEAKPATTQEQGAENKNTAQGEDTSADGAGALSAGEKEEDVAQLNSSAELQNLDSPAQARRAAKAYTFFTTAAPRPAPLPGEQLVNCVYCGKEQRATDRFCASCGRKRA